MTVTSYDVAIIGGGIIGVATARALLQRVPHLRLLLLEKEAALATHQTGHNSGVIHSGIYYRPGSLKAQLCVRGAQRLTDFCDHHGIPYQRCGKVIVAVDDSEVPRLQQVYERGMANGVPGVARIGPERLREIEPHVRGVAAIHLPHVAVVDFRAVAEAFARDVVQTGGVIRTGVRVVGLRPARDGWTAETTDGSIPARLLVNCGGLHADRVARLAGDRSSVQLVPFRGEYYALAPERASLVRGLVYPVPDPSLPFLGVHFTKMLDGGVHVGPNAVLALKREGYARRDVSLRDGWELMTNPTFWRMARRYWRAGRDELLRSLNRAVFLRAAQRLVPSLQAEDLRPSPSGVRAQAVDAAGTLLDDFVLRETPHALHVINAPSPAATASLSIADWIVERVIRLLNGR